MSVCTETETLERGEILGGYVAAPSFDREERHRGPDPEEDPSGGGEAARSVRVAAAHADRVETFGGVLRTALLALDLTQTELARRLDWSEETFRRYLDDRQSPAVAKLHAALQRRGCPPHLRFTALVWLASGRALISAPPTSPVLPPPDQMGRALRRLASGLVMDAATLASQAAEAGELATSERISAEALLDLQTKADELSANLKQLLAIAAGMHRRAAGR